MYVRRNRCKVESYLPLWLSALQHLHNLTKLFVFLAGLSQAGLQPFPGRHDKLRHDQADKKEGAGEEHEHKDEHLALPVSS